MTALRFLVFQNKFEGVITTLAYSATALSLLVDVFSREVLGQGVWGAPRFAVYTAIVAGFLGMSLAAAENNQIRPQILDAIIPVRFDVYVNRLADLISAIVYLFLTYLAIGFVISSYENNDIAAVLDWQLWPIQLVLPYSFCAVGFRYILYTVSPSLKMAFVEIVRRKINA